MRALRAMLLTFWWFPTPARAQQGEEPHISAPHKPVAPELPPPKQWHSPAVQRSMTGGLWITDPNYRAGLYLKNDVETSALTVTPVVYLANGAKYTLPDVQLEPAGSAVIDLNAGLAHLGIAPWAALSGYVEVQYRWPWDALCATVRNLDVVHSEQFNFGLVPDEKQMPKHYPVTHGNVFEGLWWKQEPNVTGFVALSNLTNRSRSVSFQISERSGHPLGERSMPIPPHGTALINLEELKSAASPDGGLRVTWRTRRYRGKRRVGGPVHRILGKHSFRVDATQLRSADPQEILGIRAHDRRSRSDDAVSGGDSIYALYCAA